MKEATDKYPEALLDMRADLQGLLVAQGVGQEEAAQISHAAIENIRQRWGGMYLPKGTAVNLSTRDREIGREWNGANKTALCQKHKLTEQRLYQILASLRAEQVAKRQMKMF